MDKYISQLEFEKLKSYSNKNIKKHNKKFIKQELVDSSYLLDNINGFSLDLDQRMSIITNEENILVISGAGSGKTLTIVGKIRYLIERLNVKKDDILCISFTNDSVKSLKDSLLKYYNYDIDVFTFHKLALNIIKKNNENVSISNIDTLEYIIDEFFYSNIPNLEILKKENKDKYIQFKNLLITFINLFKSNNYDISKFDEFLDINYSEKYILLKILKELYKQYDTELKSKCEVDFNDMINYATYIVKNNGYIKKYKYIIIDEYQDTSVTKYELIKEIKNKTNAKLFAVGDDFQSIYRFTGCNLDIFIKFNEYFNYSKILKIQNTYRNSMELIKVAGNFIMKNKYQIKKKLKSNKRLYKPIKVIYFKNIQDIFEKLINKIDTNILILGRNNNDIYKVLNNNFNLLDNGDIIYKTNTNKKLKFMTVHKSKGLEEDNVIIINLEDNICGFPSKITNNEILKLVLNEKDLYPYEEERRLFYVALTRTKNNVYLLVNKESESIFVNELIKKYRFNIQIINELI